MALTLGGSGQSNIALQRFNQNRPAPQSGVSAAGRLALAGAGAFNQRRAQAKALEARQQFSARAQALLDPKVIGGNENARRAAVLELAVAGLASSDSTIQSTAASLMENALEDLTAKPDYGQTTVTSGGETLTFETVDGRIPENAEPKFRAPRTAPNPNQAVSSELIKDANGAPSFEIKRNAKGDIVDYEFVPGSTKVDVTNLEGFAATVQGIQQAVAMQAVTPAEGKELIQAERNKLLQADKATGREATIAGDINASQRELDSALVESDAFLNTITPGSALSPAQNARYGAMLRDIGVAIAQRQNIKGEPAEALISGFINGAPGLGVTVAARAAGGADPLKAYIDQATARFKTGGGNNNLPPGVRSIKRID